MNRCLDSQSEVDMVRKTRKIAKNVLGGRLLPCSQFPNKVTGFYRDGFCVTGPTDTGTHVVCAIMTADFLQFTKSEGNDLSTPRLNFPGLVPGDRWCLCAIRWLAAYKAGVAPPVILQSTSAAVKRFVPLSVLRKFDAQKYRA
jgi:uncharacterized protein (DUF2237 family)